jgi:hypothetical protein
VYCTLQGGLRAGYQDGRWSMGGPNGVAPVADVDNLLLSMDGVPIGVTGMVRTHNASVVVGMAACETR